MINIEKFDSDLLKIDIGSYKNIDTYYIGYIATKNIGEYESIHSVNLLYFIIGELNGHIAQWAHLCQFAIDSMSKFHFERRINMETMTSIQRGNFDVDLPFKIDEISMIFSMSFRRRIDVTAVVDVSIVSFSNIFCSGILF